MFDLIRTWFDKLTTNGLNLRFPNKNFLVPPNDVMKLESRLGELMGNEELRIQMGKQARVAVVSRYSLQTVMGEWDSLFNELGIKQ